MNRLAQRAFAFTLTGSLLLPSRGVRAQASDDPCDAVERTEALREEGQYRRSRALLLQCVNAQCGGDVRRRCAATLQRLDAETPSIVVRATDAEGDDVTDVAVSLGGEQLVGSLDGMALPVDPGVHTFSFVRSGQAPVVQSITINRGEKFRPIDVVIGAPPVREAPQPEPQRPAPSSALTERGVAAGTLLGLGLVGVGSFVWLGSRARSGEDALGRCEPNCSDGRVDSVEARYLLANVSLGVGVLALGAATWLLVTGSGDGSATEDHGLAVGADGKGAFAAYSGRF